MFTRSAKRVPTSLTEENSNTNSDDNSNIDATNKFETKPRRRRKKENISDNTTLPNNNKRANYVSYPSDAEDAPNENCADIFVDIDKKAHKKKSTKTVLKELSSNNPDSDETVERKVTRSTRQTRKVNDDCEEKTTLVDTVKKTRKTKIIDTDIESVVIKTNAQENAKKTKKNKKGKRDSMPETAQSQTEEVDHVTVVKKKSNKKKGKTSNSSPVSIHGKNSSSRLEKSSASVDSFHSAAGSPVIDKDNKVDFINNLNVSQSKEVEVIQNAHSPIVSVEILEDFNSKDIDKLNKSDDRNKQCKQRKTSVNNATFDKTSNNSLVSKANVSHNTLHINETQSNKNCQGINESNLNVQNNDCTKKLGRTRNSSIKNDTSINISVGMHENMSQQSKEEISKDSKSSATKQRYSARLSNCVTENNLADKSHEKNKIIQDKKDSKMDITFEKSDSKSTTKSSLISSDATLNATYDKSDISRISITSDESSTENIVNTTPMLIESSMEETNLQNTPEKASDTKQPKPTTPLKREGTFTKSNQNTVNIDQKLSATPKKSLERTPTRRISIGTPGSTPFPFSKSSQKETVLLNVTRSIEKQARRSSLAATISTRTTRVMFCSPLDNQVPNTESKRKIVKSSLKGSNKSFVFDDSISAVRKRSYTQEELRSAKRLRTMDMPDTSAQRLSRSFSASATLSTPSMKAVTPSKQPRTKLPNFAAVHQRRFDKMESLDQCQQRKAERAKQLLTATSGVPVLEKSISKAAIPAKKQVVASSTRKSQLTIKPKPEVQSKLEAQPQSEDKPKAAAPAAVPALEKGFTRFGFRMNKGINPFSVPAENKKEKPVARKTLPTHSTAPVRKETAQAIVMGQKPSLSKRCEMKRMENRTHIKGVRTNRRFDLQMKMRGVDG